MTTTAHTHTQSDEISADALDRIILTVAAHAELARKSATRKDPVAFRRWVLRRARQTRLLVAWGLL